MRSLSADPDRVNEQARGFGDATDRPHRSETPRISDTRRRAPTCGVEVLQRHERERTITREEYHRRVDA